MLSGNTGLIEPSAHHLHVRRGVAVSGCDLGVAKPRLDGQKVNSRLKQHHRQRVTKHVRRNALALQRWHLRSGERDSAPNDMRCAKPRKGLPLNTDEKWAMFVLPDTVLTHQRAQCLNEIIGHWHHPLFPTFTPQPHLRHRPTDVEVKCLDTESLGDTCSCASEKEEQRPIAPPSSRALIRPLDERGELIAREIWHDCAVGSLGRYGEDTLSDTERRRIVSGYMVEE